MVSVYADGSSGAGGGKAGGWAFVIVRDEVEVLQAGYGGHPSTTNNVMELTGAIRGLEALVVLRAFNLVRAGEALELVSDSQYTLGMASGSYCPTTNLELAARIKQLTQDTKARTRWVRGHEGNTWNERVDSLAGKGKREVSIPAPVEGCRWIPLTKGKWTLVDDADYLSLSRNSWSAQSEGYAACRRDHQYVYLHRLLLNAEPEQKVDHVNGNTLDNRRSNLRICTTSQNSQNSKKRSGGSSRFKGVHWRDDAKKWRGLYR